MWREQWFWNKVYFKDMMIKFCSLMPYVRSLWRATVLKCISQCCLQNVSHIFHAYVCYSFVSEWWLAVASCMHIMLSLGKGDTLVWHLSWQRLLLLLVICRLAKIKHFVTGSYQFRLPTLGLFQGTVTWTHFLITGAWCGESTSHWWMWHSNI